MSTRATKRVKPEPSEEEAWIGTAAANNISAGVVAIYCFAYFEWKCIEKRIHENGWMCDTLEETYPQLVYLREKMEDLSFPDKAYDWDILNNKVWDVDAVDFFCKMDTYMIEERTEEEEGTE